MVLNLDNTTSEKELYFRVALYQYINAANFVEISMKSMLEQATAVNEYKVAMFFVLHN